ncbi:hypothetical protein [Tranquillimonas alkanivorans]|uniref:Uncharacterized protein n=1 Tax=Tranquillimonas alkanivorans TaxID=441119 RepID=A0A1I5TUT9_9RHOB|nr:hypothetical protein [Tranquillimonas alkanivorans]SFP86803.1 hypothetical protein SAMN04488047_11539 [Tranquillimonas alkanivorans]
MRKVIERPDISEALIGWAMYSTHVLVSTVREMPADERKKYLDATGEKVRLRMWFAPSGVKGGVDLCDRSEEDSNAWFLLSDLEDPEDPGLYYLARRLQADFYTLYTQAELRRRYGERPYLLESDEELAEGIPEWFGASDEPSGARGKALAKERVMDVTEDWQVYERVEESHRRQSESNHARLRREAARQAAEAEAS